jgi:2-iminoacetate synthase ThiH
LPPSCPPFPSPPLQGGIHPDFTGDTYLALLAAAKAGAPDIHVHAFSPLEVLQGARTLGLSLPAYLRRLRDAGLGSLPGTAAEVLCDDVRGVLCPDKLSAREWLEVRWARATCAVRGRVLQIIRPGRSAPEPAPPPQITQK